MLRNFFPTATGCVLRRGTEPRATLPGGNPVTAMFSYLSGAQEEMFAATEVGIWRIGVTPVSVLSGQTGGDWSVVQFATTGGTFLIGVNGSDPEFIYDGATWGGMTVTFPSGSGVSLADMSFVWVYRQRLYFVQRESMDVW